MKTFRFGTLCVSMLTLMSLGFAGIAQDAPKPDAAPAPQTAPPPPAPEAAKPAPPAAKQHPVTGSERFNESPYTIIPVDMMQTEFKLTPEQTAKIRAIRDKLKADGKGLKNYGEDGVKLHTLKEKASDDIEAVLTPEQKSEKVMQQAVKDTVMLGGLGITPALAEKMNLSSEQRQKLIDIAQDIQTKVREMKREDRKTKLFALAAEASQKTKAVLTPEQREMYDKYAPHLSKAKAEAPAKPAN